MGLNMTSHICFRIFFKNLFLGFKYVALNWTFPQRYHHQSQQPTSKQNETPAKAALPPQALPPRPQKKTPNKIKPSKKSTRVIKLNNSTLCSTKM